MASDWLVKWLFHSNKCPKENVARIVAKSGIQTYIKESNGNMYIPTSYEKMQGQKHFGVDQIK